jgi:hypothetical protein
MNASQVAKQMILYDFKIALEAQRLAFAWAMNQNLPEPLVGPDAVCASVREFKLS